MNVDTPDGASRLADGLEITRFETFDQAEGRLSGSEVKRPVASSPYSLKLSGWALSAGEQPVGVRIAALRPMRHVIMAAPLNVARSDLAARFPEAPTDRPRGFITACSLLGMPLRFSLAVEARFEDGAAVTIAEIEGSRHPLRSGHHPRFQPILLESLGRAGSTWLTQLLGSHPQVVTYRPFQFEPRMLGYWLEIVRALSHPYSYAQAISPEVQDPRAWWEGRRRSQGPLALEADPEVESWVETESIEEHATFALARVDSFYERVAQSQGNATAVRFIERAHGLQETLLTHELYEQARSIFLVRDLRDQLASRLAFIRKTGRQQFGWEAGMTPEEFVRGPMTDQVAQIVSRWHALEEDAFLLRYEDLVLDPEDTLRGLLSYLDLDSSDDTVRAVLDRARQRAPNRQVEHRTSASEQASIGRWRGDLSAETQAVCREEFAETLAEFGYETS